MTIKEFNMTVMKDETLRRILPMEVRRTYPYLTLENGLLCASFVGFRVKPEEGKLRVSAPCYFLKIACPKRRELPLELLALMKDAQGKLAAPKLRLLAYVDLGTAERQDHIMEPKSRDDLMKLDALFTEALKRYQEGGEEVGKIIDASDAILKTVLEPDQLEAIGSFPLNR